MDHGDPEAACHSSTCLQIGKGRAAPLASAPHFSESRKAIKGLSMSYLVDDVVLISGGDAEVTAQLPIQSLVAGVDQ